MSQFEQKKIQNSPESRDTLTLMPLIDLIPEQQMSASALNDDAVFPVNLLNQNTDICELAKEGSPPLWRVPSTEDVSFSKNWLSVDDPSEVLDREDCDLFFEGKSEFDTSFLPENLLMQDENSNVEPMPSLEPDFWSTSENLLSCDNELTSGDSASQFGSLPDDSIISVVNDLAQDTDIIEGMNTKQPTNPQIQAWLNILKGRHPDITPPDISGGLGKRQEKEDIVSIERFCLQAGQFMVHRGELYVFDGPCWRKLGVRECAVYLRTLLDHSKLTSVLTTREYKELFNLMLCNPNIQQEGDLPHPQHRLNLADRTLNLETMDFYPHNSEDYFFSFINVYYDELMDLGESVFFENFISQISNGDPLIRQQILELVALTLTGYEVKAFYVILGPSNTGKTEFGRFLMELRGRENCASLGGIQDFARQFTTSALDGKDLVVCLDLPDEPLPAVAIGMTKQIVGDDPIKVEAKYKNSKTIYRKPLLLFCGNHPIRIPEMAKEQALLNRMIVIPFSNPIKMEERQEHFYLKLLEEAPYIISQAALVYRELIERNFVLTRVEIPEEYHPEDSRESFQDIQSFVDTYCELDDASETSTSSLHHAYEELVLAGQFEHLSKIEFARLLSETLDGRAKPVKRVKSSQERGYRGIRLCQDLQ